MRRSLFPLILMMGVLVVANGQTPTIESFSPASGAVGDTIAITGTGFSSTPTNYIVRFGGVKAEVVSVTGTTRLEVKVPTGAAFAPITVTDTSSAKRLTAYSPSSFILTFSAIAAIDITSFATRVDFSTSPGTSPRAIAAADIDGDGRPDIVVANTPSGTIGIYRNIGTVGGIQSNSLAARVEYLLGSASSRPAAIAFGDLDGDGDLDLAIADTSASSVYVWQNASTQGTIDTSSVSSFTVGTRPYGVAIADLDGDGKPDIVTANKGSNNISILRNTTSNGTISFAAAMNVSTGSSTAPVDVAIADFDNNGIFEPDIITANSGTGTVAVLQNGSSPGSISFSLVLTKSTGSVPNGVVTADLDGDGLIDVATANSGVTTIAVIRNNTLNQTVTFENAYAFDVGASSFDIVAANIEGDGKPDLVVSLGTVDSIAVLRNTAVSGSITTSSFAAKVGFAASSGLAGVAAADFDGDGKPDIIAANRGSNSFSLFRNKAVKLEQESNDSYTGANPITIGETIQGYRSGYSDVDYYRFFAFAGDTMEVFVNQYGTSQAVFCFEIYDSSGQGISLNNRWGRSDFPKRSALHNVVPINQSKTYYLRVIHPNNSTSFPSSASGNTPGPIQMSAAQTASDDTGAYRLRLERFSPSRPDVREGPYAWRITFNSVRLGVELAPNGLNTTTYVEYGLSPSALTVSIPGDYTFSGIDAPNSDVSITGLAPNQRYYFRWTATNSLGSSSGNVTYFDTPSSPVGWEILDLGNLNPAYTFHGISFPSTTTGYAVGHWNGVYKTTDGGKTWTALWPSVNMWVEGVCFSLPSTGLVVGGGGGISMTTDGGITWSDKKSPHYSQQLHAVRYFSPSTAIAVGDGGVIMRSTGGWETWDTVRTGTNPLLDISVINTTTAFVSGVNGTILKTTNAGAAWSIVPPPTGVSGAWLWGIHFFNLSTGFVCGDGMNLHKTTNGGTTWSEFQGSEYRDLLDITFRDVNNGVAVGRNGRILRTTDGGTTWNAERTGTYAWLGDVAFVGRTITAIGEPGIMSYIEPISEIESNDSFVEAMQVELRDEIEAAIQPVGDFDYYAITLASGDTIEISTAGRDTLTVNGMLELYDSGQNLLMQNDDFVPGDSIQSRIVCVVPSAGTYYARYSGKDGLKTGNYVIRFRKISLRPSIPFAGTASIHSSTSATLAAPVVPNNLSTTVEFEYGPTTSYGSIVTSLESPIDGQQLTNATALLTGLTEFIEYHFRVKAQNVAGVTYGPDVTFITSLGNTRPEVEPNNLANQATTIFIGDTVNAFLSSTADADYYRFQAKAGDTLDVFVKGINNSNIWMRLQVIDSTNGWTIVWNENIPRPSSLHSAIVLTNTGIYQVRVSSRDNSSSYPNAAADVGQPQLQPSGIASGDTGSYQLRLRRFVPSAPDVRHDSWPTSTLHESVVIRAEVSSNGLPTTVTVEYGLRTSFSQSIQYSGNPIIGVSPQVIYIPISSLQPQTGFSSRVIATNAAGSDTSEVSWWSTPKAPEGWATRPVTDRPDIGLRDVAFKNEQEGIVVGDNELMRTTDGGNTWMWAQNPGVWAGCVGFANDTIATVAGNSFARTTNAGITWTYQFNIGGWTSRVSYANATVGYSVGEWGRIAKTNDAGITWSTVRLNAQYLNGLFIFDPETVVAVGEQGTILRTSNGGASWDSLSSGTTKHFYGVAFTNASTGFAVGMEGMVKRTTDGGTTWATVNVNEGNWFRDIAFRDLSRGIIVGDGGTILRTTDGGATWNRQESGTYNQFQGVSYVGRRAVAVTWYGDVARYLDPYDESEPNNSTAQAFTLKYDERLDGSISPAGDIDYYKFTAAVGDTVELLATNATGSQLNAYLELLNSGSTPVAQNDNFIPNDSSQSRVVYAVLSAGTYYIRISSASAGGTGGYIVRLQKTSLIPIITTVSSSNVTPTAATFSAFVVPNSLSTNVAFQWGTGGSFGNSTPGNPSSVSGQQRAPVTATLSGLTPFTQYNFRVIASNAAGSSLTQSYSFFTPRPVALAEAESNDSGAIAQLVTLSDTVAARIFPSSDIDYYKFHGEAGDTVELQAVSNGNGWWRLRMVLIDSASFNQNLDPRYFENQYLDDGWFPSDSILHDQAVLGRNSTYYLIILNEGGFTDSDTATYWVHLRRFSPSPPILQSGSWPHKQHYSSTVLSTHVAPNGLNTSVSFKYGPTPTLGTTVAGWAHPLWFPNGISGIRFGQVFSEPITGLQPGTRYYMTATATNSAGQTTQNVNSFDTPPAPEGWDLIPIGSVAPGRRISFPSRNVGYFVGNWGTLFKTTDGGATWVDKSSVLSVHDHLEGVSFVNADTGIAVGLGPRILKTTNGGDTWTYFGGWNELGISSQLYDIRMLDANTAVAVSGDPYGKIIRTTDAGTTWSIVCSSAWALHGICFSPAKDTGYAVGDGGSAFRTTDAGQTWQEIVTLGGAHLRDAWFFDGRNGFAVGYPKTIIRTTDAGASWSTISTSGSDDWYNEIAFADSINGIVVGGNGTILRTYNGGSTWVRQESGTWNWLAGAAFVGRRAIVTGDGGIALTSVGLLAAPSNLVATYASGNLVNISWNDNANGETGYFVERKIGAAGSYSLRRTTGANVSSIVDTVLKGREYYYRVRAYAAGVDTSVYSNVGSTKVALLYPTGLDAVTISSTRINLSWQSETDAKDGFKIERKDSASGIWRIIDSVANLVTTYQNINLTPSRKYYYRVFSYNTDTYSQYSPVDSALTAPGRPTGVAILPVSWTNVPDFQIAWGSPSVKKVWYKLDSPPSAGSPGSALDATNGRSFQVTLTKAGSQWIYFVLEDIEGNKDYFDYDSVMAFFDNVKPQITHDPNSVGTVTINNGVVVSSLPSVSAQIQKTGGYANLSNALVEYKKSGENTIIQMNYASAGGGTVQIPSSAFTTSAKANGVDYRVVAIDAADNREETQWYSIRIAVQNNTSSDFVLPPVIGTDNTALVKSYRMWSVPLELADKKPSGIVESPSTGLGPHAKDGVNYYHWRMQRWANGAYQDYEDFKNENALDVGNGFFIVSREGNKIITVGSGNLVRAQDMLEVGIPVSTGWNMVGNPFAYDFPADSLYLVSGSIQSRAYYDGSGNDNGWWTGVDATFLKKWEGLAIKVDQNTYLRFHAVPPPGNRKAPPISPQALSAEKTIEKEKKGGWILQFDSRRLDSDLRDKGNTIGMVPGASDNYDRFDAFQPPLFPGSSMALYFTGNDGGLSRDLRALNGSGATWDVKVVTGDRATRVKLEILDVVPLSDPGLKAYLLDLDEKMAFNLRNVREIEFNSKEGVRSFKAVIGTQSYVDSMSSVVGIDLVPQAMKLFNNYPNPFNPSTAIRYTVPGQLTQYKVSLKVYNVIGQEVATLVDRDQLPGYYEVTFDARGLSSGTYVYRIIVSGGTKESIHSDVKKMMLIK